MKKKNYLLLLGLTVPLITNAQQVVATSGGNMTNNTVQVNWTIGETITETSSTNKTALISGLNQPSLKLETSVENIKDKLNVSVFPNPTSQFVNIKYEGQLPIKSKILSLNGTVLSVSEIKDQNSQLDFSNKANGIYIVEITDKSGKSNTYRIVKQ
jgi:hypothetical protein